MIDAVQSNPWEIFSFDEKKEAKMDRIELSQCVQSTSSSTLRECSSISHNLTTCECRFNQRSLSRIYPAGLRVGSSNYHPSNAWNSGCHFVCILERWHRHPPNRLAHSRNQCQMRVTGGIESPNSWPSSVSQRRQVSRQRRLWILAQASSVVGLERIRCWCFREHGAPSVSTDSHGTGPQFNPLRSSLSLISDPPKVLSARQLPKNPQRSSNSIVDPFVMLTVIGIPSDCKEFRTSSKCMLPSPITF